MNLLPPRTLHTLRGDATLSGALYSSTFLLRPPLRYLAQTATLSGANRYVIRRESLQADRPVMWLGKRICPDRIARASSGFWRGIGSSVLAEGTIPV